MNAPAPLPAKSSRISYARVIILGLIAAAAAGGYYAYVVSTTPKVEPIDVSRQLGEFARLIQETEKLAASFTDANGDKLADPPTDAAKFLNPAELTFTVVVQDDPVEAEKIWKPLMDHLAAATGKPVKYLKEVPVPAGAESKPGEPMMEPLRTTDGQIAAMRDGRLHITAFNTGAVPLAVNRAGFHPLFAPADEQGRFDYQMQIIVPGGSPITDPAGLKGKTIALVALSSNSGGRAPLVLLQEKFDLRAGRDYQFIFTGHHANSIADLTGGRGTPNFEAACVASDMLQQKLADQSVDPSRVKVIYSSSSFPKLAFGVPYNLSPELHGKIAAALASYRFTGPLGEKFKTEKRDRFAPIVYARDFADVLAIDRKLVEYYTNK